MPSLLPILLLVLVSLALPATCHRHHSRHPSNEDSLNEISDAEQDHEQDQEQDQLLVLAHSRRVYQETSCEVPKPQVIHVSDHYPGKYYQPHCTLLHRCGKHSGCCAVKSLKCVAAEKEKVTLYFNSVKIGGNSPLRIEKLVFTNHTRCGCALSYDPNLW